MDEWSVQPAWFVLGLLGQAAFFSRFLVQWVASERAGRSTVPPAFWWLSLLGAALLLAYAIHRRALTDTPELYGEYFRDRARLGAFITARDYVESHRMRQRLIAATTAAMADVDGLFTHNQYGPAESFAASQRSFPFFNKPYPTMPFNVTGQPALTLCAGFAESGLPIGFQLAGKPFEDDLLLRVGHAFEQARGDLGRHPPV